MNGQWAATFRNLPALKHLRPKTCESVESWIRHGYIRTIAENSYLKDIHCCETRGRSGIDEAMRETGLPDSVVKLFTFIETPNDVTWCVLSVAHSRCLILKKEKSLSQSIVI
jgi:hypothetical protein